MASNFLGKISMERTISAAVIVIASFACLLSGGAILAAVLYAVSIIGFLELTKVCGVRERDGAEKYKKINILEVTGCAAVTVYYLVLYFAPEASWSVMVVIMAFIAMMFVYVFGFPRFHADQVMSAYSSLVYAPVMLSFVFMTRQLENGIYLVWMIFISSWVSDTFAYLTGVLFGRHRLAPVLSPKKSIEGAVGGIAGAASFGAAYGAYLDSVLGLERFVVLFAVVGGVGSVISQVGDLAASAIKRNHGIKDYGKLIPGHGGIMDRFDSVTFTAPITYFLILVFG